MLRPEPLRPELLRLVLARLVLRPVDEPVLRERVDEPLLLVDELVLRERDVEEELRREVALPVAVLAAFWAAFAACSKSLRSALPNLVESRRASVTNLPRPLYSVLVPLAASLLEACLLRSVSAFCAEVSD